MFFFFKQKTAYEIKECDWSSDVCSSDLLELVLLGLRRVEGINPEQWKKLTGCSLTDQTKKVIEKMGGPGKTAPFSPSLAGRLLTVKNDNLCLTQEGLLLYDTICIKLTEAFV